MLVYFITMYPIIVKKRLQGIQYNCLRLILNKPLAYSSTEMHKNLKLNTIQERSKYLHEKYI